MKNGWDIIRNVTKQATRTQIAIAAVCMLIGLLVVTQLRTYQTSAQVLQSATESDLSQLISSLNNEVNALKAEAASLRLQQFKIERASNDSSAIMKESFKNINNLKVLSGITRVSGKGIRIKIQDEESVLNSSDLVDVVTELRVGGAEAISINGIRVVTSSGVTQNRGRIYIDGNLVAPPFEIITIGDPDVLNEAMTIAGGIRDKLTSLSGVSFIIKKETAVDINAIAASQNIESSQRQQ